MARAQRFGGVFAARLCRLRPLLALLALAPTLALAAEPRLWGNATRPSTGATHIIGGPANGCIAGAKTLPPDGIGYEAIRLSRHRNFGHADTIGFVERLGKAATQSGLPIFYVGDMSQPRGGPMAFGHGSHQNGLDVDIWFNLADKQVLPISAREELDLPSMVLADKSGIDKKLFGERQVRLLRLASADPRVDRIFVNPRIKEALCTGYAGATVGGREWLHKIRPWYGHDEHFHVRLSCPVDAPDCVQQPSVPAGDGCDAASLGWWLRLRPPTTPVVLPTTPRPPKPNFPAACRAVLAAR